MVYQMNDTVESFLVFRKAIFTGTYKKDYEGKLDASYDRDQDRYVLGVRQGDSVITLFYQKLELEVNLYNYGEIAHFWVPRYEKSASAGISDCSAVGQVYLFGGKLLQ